MYNILISGYYGFDNIGDESILRTLVTSLRERIPDCSLTVLSHSTWLSTWNLLRSRSLSAL